MMRIWLLHRRDGGKTSSGEFSYLAVARSSRGARIIVCAVAQDEIWANEEEVICDDISPDGEGPQVLCAMKSVADSPN